MTTFFPAFLQENIFSAFDKLPVSKRRIQPQAWCRSFLFRALLGYVPALPLPLVPPYSYVFLLKPFLYNGYGFCVLKLRDLRSPLSCLSLRGILLFCSLDPFLYFLRIYTDFFLWGIGFAYYMIISQAACVCKQKIHKMCSALNTGRNL